MLSTNLGRWIMRRTDVEKTTGLSRSAIYQKMGEGTFPKAKKIGPRAVGWDSQEIQVWIDSKLGACQ